MPDPIVTASLIGAGTNILGGAFGLGAGDRAASRQDYWNKKNYELGLRQFEEGVQTRVKDAQAAGISPLAALGLSGTSLPNIGIAREDGGRRIGEGISAAGRAIQEGVIRKNEAEIAKMNAETNKANADAYSQLVDSQAMRARADASRLLRGPLMGVSGVPGQDLTDGVPAMVAVGPSDVGPTDWRFLSEEAAQSTESIIPALLTALMNVGPALRRTSNWARDGARNPPDVEQFIGPIATPDMPTGRHYGSTW